MTFHDRGTTWFLAQLKPNCANVAEKNLQRQGFETFLPKEEGTRRCNGKTVTVMRPLFPGYILVAFNAARGLWRVVNSTYGVTRLVSFGPEPAVVPLGIVSQLMRHCDASGRFRSPEVLEPGDQVRFNTGPFANFVTEIVKVGPDRRVWVLMEIMGGQRQVAANAEQLRAV